MQSSVIALINLRTFFNAVFNQAVVDLGTAPLLGK